MYYYGNNGYYPTYGQSQTPCCGGTYGGYTPGYGMGAAIWIVLFILLVIIIGAWGFGNQSPNNWKGNLSFYLRYNSFFGKIYMARGC